MDGVAKAIGLLELELGIPEEKSVLKQTLPPGMDAEEYFFDHLYEIENFLTNTMREFAYIRQTMERVIL